jgi:hypothetical protein
MGAISSLVPNLNLKSIAGGIGGIGQDIAKIGNASSGVIPTTGGSMPVAPKAVAAPTGGPQAPTPPTLPGVPAPQVPVIATPGAGGGMIPSQPLPTAPLPTGQPINGGDFNSVYGVDTGTAITNLLNSEGGGAASTVAQQIIQANAPNVAKGSADLNTGLAAAGISPSSSVSAIENANYMGQVQQQNLAEEAKVGLSEQEMQQQLLESLLPSQQQRQTDSSGWSIFGDIMQGIGDVAGIALL